jgi:hypothetical protein
MPSRIDVLRLAGLLTLTAALAGAAAAQQVVDRGTLLIMQGGRLVGQEEFVVERGRRSGAPDGFTIASVVAYPAERPTRRLTAVVEFGPDSQPAATLVEAEDGELRRVLIRLGPRRVTVRVVTPSGEAAREYPSAPRHLVLDDSLFAAHAVELPVPPGTVRSITLREGGRGTADVSDHGSDRTSVGTAQRTLHHISVTMGGERRDLWYDERGRLVKLAIPSRGLTALRSP